MNKRWIVFSVCLILFILIMLLVIFKNELYIDKYSSNFISNFITNGNTKFIIFITNLGSELMLIFITFIMMLLFKNHKVKICILLNLISIFVINNILIKNIISRPRPIGSIVSVSGYSFPSGHMAISTAVYGYLIFLLYKYIKNKNLKIILISLLSMIILLIGISRIYLGVHYASDVIGGLLFSIVYLTIFITLTNKYIIKNKY